MIFQESGIFPVVVFDDNDGWDSVRKLCPFHLDYSGQNRLENSLKSNVKCVVIEKHYIDKDYRDTFKGDFDRLLYTYIESGIPVIAGVPGHVIALFGHGTDLSICKQVSEDMFSSEFCTSWLVNNDNCSPFEILLKNGGGGSKFKFEDIDSFIAPLAEKIFMSAENFEEVVKKVLDDEVTGIKHLSPILLQNPLVSRIYLTTVKSYRKKLSDRGMGNPLIENIYRELPLPHFIWVCELSSPSEYANGNVLGEIIWDATRNVWETEGWIAIHYPEKLLIDTGSALNGVQEIHSFDLTNDTCGYSMYCSNLKEI